MSTHKDEKATVMTARIDPDVEANPEQGTEVVLINMPFGNLAAPSLGLSLLKASLKPLAISAKIFYLTLRFAELIGGFLYLLIANGMPSTVSFSFAALVGDWIFAEALFGPGRLDTDGYIEEVLRREFRSQAPEHDTPANAQTSGKKLDPETLIQHLLKARGKANGFLDECVTSVIRCRPKIVGFTSVFQQQVASLALAKRLKEQAPDVFIVFGGANCEGVMGAELIRQFPFIDAVVSGEGEVVFPELVRRVLEKRSVADLQGVHSREGAGLKVLNGRYPNAPSVQNMDALPLPDYQDFFEQWEASPISRLTAKGISPRLIRL